MGSSSEIKSGGIVTFSIKVDGSAIPDEERVHSIDINNSINNIAKATITILDGAPSTGDFEASSSSTFVPGGKVKIEVGYDGQNTSIFEGIITEQNIRIDQYIGSALEVVCYDEAIKMTVGRKSITFANKKNSDIISSIIGNYSGLTANVTSTENKLPSLVQYNVSDWDFIRTRAEANGLIISTINNKVNVFAPDADTTSVSTITFGDDIYELKAKLNAVNQLSTVKANSWDYKNQEVISETAANEHAGPGNLSSKTLSDVVGLTDFELQTTAPLSDSELTNWSKAQMTKSCFSKIQGTVSTPGDSIIFPGKYITLKGVGDRFNGDHFVSGIHHEISNGNWMLTCELGLSPNWISEQPEIIAPPASGLLPGVQGLFNGTVKKMYEDPDSQYRVLVDVPIFDSNGEGIWARLTNFYATSGFGAFFMPEVGDEVVVGFLNEDPRFPIILGSMYSSSKNKPYEDYSPNEKNSTKAIVSKSGIALKFDDENEVFSITTASNNKAVFSDKDKQVSITDQNGNRIVMSDEGITIFSEKEVSIESSQSLNLKGDQGVNIESSGGDVNIQGLNIKNTADESFKAQGSATAELSGGAETTIKGAMVMIN
ncbi:MAG: type VI secretion system tip protein VgrG [Flavobacteriaceae bacterium]|nr:type VI secretion system tip protein VgrG [Flavobacteriaceae bacterium]